MFIPLIFYYFNYFPDTHDGAGGHAAGYKKKHGDIWRKREKEKLEQAIELRVLIENAIKKSKEKTPEKRFTALSDIRQIYKPNLYLERLRDDLQRIEKELQIIKKQQREEEDINAILLALY